MKNLTKLTFSSYEIFPNADIVNSGIFSDQFLQIGIKSFHDACRWVNDLPYDYNTNMVDSMLIFTEKKGICLTKHGAIARLAEELVYRFVNSITFYISPKSNFFQRNGTGASLISAIPLSILSLSSTFDATRMCLRNVRAIFEKAHSIRFSQEPCLGV